MSNLSEEEMSQSLFSFTSAGSHGLIKAPLQPIKQEESRSKQRAGGK